MKKPDIEIRVKPKFVLVIHRTSPKFVVEFAINKKAEETVLNTVELKILSNGYLTSELNTALKTAKHSAIKYLKDNDSSN